MVTFKPSHQSTCRIIFQKQRLRIATLSGAILLYSALLTGLFLSPSATELISNQGQSIIKVRAEVASIARVTSKPADERPSLAVPSAPKAKRDRPKPEANPVTGMEVAQSGHRLSMPKPIVPEQMAQTVPPIEIDVTQIVASLIAAQMDGDPLKFRVSENGTVTLSVDASTFPLSSALSLESENSEADCRVAQKLQIAVQNDPSMKQVLGQVPRSKRSVANVIMVWDGAWVGNSNLTVSDQPAEALEPAPELLKVGIQGHFRAITTECLSQTVLGPEFILIDYGSEPTVLVFGSGEWRWADLVDPIAPAAGALHAFLSKSLNSER